MMCTLHQAAEGDEERAAGVEAWLRSRDPDLVAQLVRKSQHGVRVCLDGRVVELQHGLHFELPS